MPRRIGAPVGSGVDDHHPRHQAPPPGALRRRRRRVPRRRRPHGRSGGREDGEPHDDHAAKTPADWDSRLAPIAAEVAKLRHLKFDHPVAAEFLDDAAFEKRVAIDKGKLSKADKEEIERAQGQLRAVGLIGPDVDIVDAMSSLQAAGVLAYYDPKTKQIVGEGQEPRRRLHARDRRARAHARAPGPALRPRQARARRGEGARLHRVAHARRRRRGAHPGRLPASPCPRATRRPTTSERAAIGQGRSSRRSTRTPCPSRSRSCSKRRTTLGAPMLGAVIAEGERRRRRRAVPPSTGRRRRVPDARRRSCNTVCSPRWLRRSSGRARSARASRTCSARSRSTRCWRHGWISAWRCAAADGWGGDSMVTFTRDGTTCLRSTFAGRDSRRHHRHRRCARRSGRRRCRPAPRRSIVRRSGSTLTACDPGAGATEAPNQAVERAGVRRDP